MSEFPNCSWPCGILSDILEVFLLELSVLRPLSQLEISVFVLNRFQNASWPCVVERSQQDAINSVRIVAAREGA